MAKRNIGRYVRFPQFCQWGMSMHSGKIIGVEKDCYVIEEGIFIRKAWINGVDFIDPPDKK